MPWSRVSNLTPALGSPSCVTRGRGCSYFTSTLWSICVSWCCNLLMFVAFYICTFLMRFVSTPVTRMCCPWGDAAWRRPYPLPFDLFGGTPSPGPGAGRGASRGPQAYSELVFLKFPWPCPCEHFYNLNPGIKLFSLLLFLILLLFWRHVHF